MMGNYATGPVALPEKMTNYTQYKIGDLRPLLTYTVLNNDGTKPYLLAKLLILELQLEGVVDIDDLIKSTASLFKKNKSELDRLVTNLNGCIPKSFKTDIIAQIIMLQRPVLSTVAKSTPKPAHLLLDIPEAMRTTAGSVRPRTVRKLPNTTIYVPKTDLTAAKPQRTLAGNDGHSLGRQTTSTPSSGNRSSQHNIKPGLIYNNIDVNQRNGLKKANARSGKSPFRKYTNNGSIASLSNKVGLLNLDMSHNDESIYSSSSQTKNFLPYDRISFESTTSTDSWSSLSAATPSPFSAWRPIDWSSESSSTAANSRKSMHIGPLELLFTYPRNEIEVTSAGPNQDRGKII